MGRNSSSKALILSTFLAGEDNRIVNFLTPEQGVVSAMLYGGRKSKLRSMVSPYNRGDIWLYTDISKGMSKITDFSPVEYHLSFRDSLYKIWAASVCAELLIKTHCGGDYEQTWILANAFLDGMEYSDEKSCKLALLRFLWRYCAILGIQPDITTCIRCGQNFDLSGKNGQYGVVYYPAGENGCICSSCSETGGEAIDNGFLLHRNSYDYLLAVSTLPPKAARSMLLSDTGAAEIRSLVFFLVSSAVDGHLKTLSPVPDFV